MNKLLVTTAAAAFIFSAHGAVAGDIDLIAYDLEPCINGDVSATGLFASQEEEDRLLAERQALETELDLEPCMDGGVSATGNYASQAEEDMVQYRITGG